ncbi:MAG: hypothetical protein WBS22_11780 [Methylocystis sp.]|jgi:hypothetical protein
MVKSKDAVTIHRSIRSLTLSAFGGLAVLLSCVSPSHASKAVVIGDSIGVGISMAGHVPRLAHNSVTIRSADALSQLKRVPRDSVAIISLGTNDAVGSIKGVESGIDKLIALAKSEDLHVVWIGPPCVRKDWNKNVVKLDEILKARLAGKFPYVSAADSALCDGELRAGDGVHFNMRGYSMLWARASEAAGVAIEGGKADQADEPTSKGSKRKRIHAKKRHAPEKDSNEQAAVEQPAAREAHAEVAAK